MLAFVEAAFDLALDFTTRASPARKHAKGVTGAPDDATGRRGPD